MGDYLNDHPTGVHVLVKRNGVIMVENYWDKYLNQSDIKKVKSYNC